MKTGLAMRCAAIIVLMLGISYLGVTQEQRQNTALPPGGKGGALLAEHCTKCHNLDEVVRLRQTRAQWEDTVYSMVARGAPVFSDEAGLIIDYLSKTFGPDVQK